METDRYKIWAKGNKRNFVNKFLERYKDNKSESPVAIFMAGLPGAGKTEISRYLAKELGNFVRIDMDEIAEQIPGYKPENANDFREAATLLVNTTLKEVYRNNISFILDGTFGSSYALRNIERALKHGYYPIISYIHQDPKCAFDFTVAREKVERRGIEKSGFIKTYFNIKQNLDEAFRKYSKEIAVEIILKNTDNNIKKAISNASHSEFDEVAKNSYTIDSLDKYISGK